MSEAQKDWVSVQAPRQLAWIDQTHVPPGSAGCKLHRSLQTKQMVLVFWKELRAGEGRDDRERMKLRRPLSERLVLSPLPREATPLELETRTAGARVVTPLSPHVERLVVRSDYPRGSGRTGGRTGRVVGAVVYGR